MRMSNLINIGINMVPIPPEDLVEAGQLAEELGYESLWVGEHFIVPWETKAPYPYGETAPFTADMNFLEPLAALSALGVATKRVRLGTCLIVLPLRDLGDSERGELSRSCIAQN